MTKLINHPKTHLIKTFFSNINSPEKIPIELIKIFFPSCRVLNINSFIKIVTLIVGMLGLIFTAYRLVDENKGKTTIPVAAPAPAPVTTTPVAVGDTKTTTTVDLSRNLQAQVVDLEEVKK